MFRVYLKEKISKELFTVNLTSAEVQTVMEGNLFLDHPKLKEEECIIIERDAAVQNPLYDEVKGEIREMTREEKILLLGEEDLLINGEYIEKGEIKKIKYDENLKYYRPTWNREQLIWYDSIKREELVEMRKNKLLEYASLEKEKTDLENIKFSTTEEIAILEEKMNLLKEEIDKIASDPIYLTK